MQLLPKLSSRCCLHGECGEHSKQHISKLLTDEGNDLSKLLQVCFSFQNPQQQQQKPQQPATKKPQTKSHPKHFFLISTAERIYLLDS